MRPSPTSSTTKVRPVLDASAPTSIGVTLNDLLEPGPNLLSNLLGVLLSHRAGKFAITSDLQAAFYQIGIDEADRDAFRIILPIDPAKPLVPGNFELWRFTRLVMGASPSPFILLCVIKWIASSALESGSTSLSKDELRHLIDGLYVDNIAICAETPADAKRIVSGLRDLFTKAAFHLREFASNLPGCLVDVPEPDRVTSNLVSFLGLHWDIDADRVHLKVPSMPAVDSLTRATLASAAYSPFDPAGYAAPLILHLRLLLRSAFAADAPWDEAAPDDVKAAYAKLLPDFGRLSDVSVPRHAVLHSGATVHLVLFSDASPSAYGFTLYACQSALGASSSRLLLGKARLAPSPDRAALGKGQAIG